MRKRIKFNIGCLGEYMIGKTYVLNSKLGIGFTFDSLGIIVIERSLDEAIFDDELYIFKFLKSMI